jgi:hypothetical protein
MSTYEIGDESARIIYAALRYLEYHEDAQDRPELTELLALFAPPAPPTAEELAEALRTALADDYPQAGADALAVLKRYDATRGQ